MQGGEGDPKRTAYAMPKKARKPDTKKTAPVIRRPRPARDQPGEQNGTGDGFPIVGIGASAGGLEAVTRLLRELPADPGVALVVVQHLDPDHKSMLVELLARATKLPVREVADGMQVERNHVYVIPRNASMAISGGQLHVTARKLDAGKHMPIDRFMLSLADDQKSRAIGVILSGTASDGTLGVRAIKAEGGITFAQDEQSAKFPDMPLNAVSTGCVDFVLPPKRIAKELAALSRHPYVRASESAESPDSAPDETQDLQGIFRLLRAAAGVDFAHYKPATIRRRVARRMAVHKIDDIGEYAHFLTAHPGEIAQLYEDLLINVTSFFRDAAAFLMLKTTVFPRLLKDRPANSAIRVWVAGCSSGEEVYSIAISLLEAVAESGKEFDIQLFGTDISDLAIERARTGLYPANISQDVSADRLGHFFARNEAGYQISKRVRDLCVFARQNLIKDPPFSRLDLISCRNVLIYLDSTLQKRVISTMHYALNPGGFLLLGESESLGTLETAFEPEDKKVKLYSKKIAQDTAGSGRAQRLGASAAARADLDPFWTEASLQKAGDQLVLKRFGPPGVAINEKMEVVSFRGDTSPFLLARHGAPSLQLQKMARGALAPILRSAIGRAKKLGKAVQHRDLELESGGWSRRFNLDVVPVTSAQVSERLWMVLFQETGASKISTRKGKAARRGAAGNQRSRSQVSAELGSMKDGIQSLLEEYEATNEELQSANEEIQSSNEELQSTNEEMQTSKEELQAGNEELVTANEEMHRRNVELNEAHNDLLNLFSNVNTPIVMLGNDLRIRRFTPAAERIMNLIATDVGRPMSDINLGLMGKYLQQDVPEVIESLGVRERMVQDGAGRWHMLRVRPYRTQDNRIEGAVVVLVDIDDLKRSQDLARTILDTMRECLVVLDGKNRVKTANRYFYRAFNITAAQTEGREIYDAADGLWNLPNIHALLEGARFRDTRLQNVKVDFERLGQPKRTMYLNAQRLPDSDMVLLIAREPSDLL